MIVPSHHGSDSPGVNVVRLQVAGGFTEIPLGRYSRGELGADLRGFIGVRDSDNLYGVPKGYVEDFVVENDDVVCLECTDHFYTFPRKVNGG